MNVLLPLPPVMRKCMHFVTTIVQKHPPLLALSSLFAICVLFFHQPLFSGGIINATDILTQSYFWNVFIKENLFADPCFRTWLPYINAGTPFSGGLDLLLRPVMFLTLLFLPVHTAINYEMIIYFFLMGVCMYFYMRELQVSPLSAFLAALFLMLNGEIVSLLNAGHVNKIGAIAFAPLVFWAFERALRRKTLAAFLLSGAALSFQFWQGHIQISFYICIAVGLYYVVHVGLIYKQTRSLQPVWKLTAFALLMVTVFLLLSAVSFLPLLSFARVSERAEGVSYEFATSWSMPPEELITYLIPGFFGLRRLNHFEHAQILPYWGRMPFTQTGRYFGILPLLLAVLAVCFVRRKHVLTLAVLAGVVLLMGMGKYLPTYHLLYDYAPGFDKFRVPQMILFLFAFAASGLAGFGAEWLLAELTAPKEKRLRLFLLAGIGIFLCSWLITLLLPQISEFFIAHFEEALLRQDGTPDIAAARLKNIFYGLAQFSVLLGMALFVLGLRLATQLRRRWLVAAMLLLYLADIWLFNSKYIDTIPLANSFYVNENDAIRYFKAHPGLYRILSAADAPESYAVANKYVAYHLFSVSGYEAVGVQYYNDYLQNMALGSAMVDLLNIKYIILPKNVELNGQKVEVGKMIGPYKIVQDTDAVLLENLNCLPRAFPVHHAYVIKNREEMFAALLDPKFDPAATVLLEEPPPAPLPPENVSATQSTVAMTAYSNRTIQLKATMAADGFLVLSEKYYPGWQAYVDGSPTRIYKADYTLQAIFLPKGEHTVIFAYQPKQFLLGFIITALTGLGLLVVYVINRKSQNPPGSKLQARPAGLFRKARSFYYSKKLLYGIICFGVLLHVGQYLFNRSLHVDEAPLALNIIRHSFARLLEPLDYNQGAPLGFLMIERVLVQLFGSHEYILRFFPLLSAVLAIILFARIAPHFISPAGVPAALAFFALAEPLIIYSSTVKQYSSDVFFALLIYFVSLHVQAKHFQMPAIAVFAVTGSAAVFCSHPAVFVLAGVGTGLVLICARRKAWGQIGQLAAASLLWGATFLAVYLLSVRNLANNELSQRYWEGAFVKFPPATWADLALPLKALIDFVGMVIGLAQPIFNTINSYSIFKLIAFTRQLVASPDASLGQTLLFMLFGLVFGGLFLWATFITVLGGIRLFWKSKSSFWLALAPVGFMLAASVLHKFPLGQRLMLFLVPTVALLLGEGIAQAGTGKLGDVSKNSGAATSQSERSRTSFLRLISVGILFIYPFSAGVYHLFEPRTDQELKPVLQYVQNHQQPGDVLYLYYAAQHVFTYYAPRFGLDSTPLTTPPTIQGVASRTDWRGYMKDLDQLRGKKRVWLIFLHVYGDEELFFLEYLASIGGKRLDALQGIKASVHLYDLSSEHG